MMLRAWRAASTRAKTFAVGAALFLGATVVLVAGMGHSESVVGWMHVFGIEDVGTVHQTVEFFRELRVPIPPNLALLEIIDYQLTGDISIATGFAYHAYIVISYACVVALVYPSRVRLLLAGLLGLLFICATKYIHPGNAEIYDVAAPCFFLLFVALLRAATELNRPNLATTALVLSGFFLSMFELSRPFVIYLLPFALATAWLRIRIARRFLLFLVPLLVLSGGWHAHLLIAHGQTTSSNHAGFNMWRCWEEQIPNQSFRFVHEEDTPLPGANHYYNLNNPQHLINSKLLQDRIVHYAIRHRSASLGFIARRVLAFTAGEPTLYYRSPPKQIATIYSIAVRVTSLIFLVGLAGLVCRFAWLVIRRRELATKVANLDSLIVVIGALSIAILAVGEKGEEARFVISLLPLFATVPPIHRLILLQCVAPAKE